MPTRRTASPAVPATPPRPTDRQIIVGLTIKEDLAAAAAVWAAQFAEPIKASLLAEPAPAPGSDEVTERVAGGVRVSLTRTYPKPTVDIERMRADVSRLLSEGRLTLADMTTLFDSGAVSVANPAAVVELLVARCSARAADYCIQPADPLTPTGVSLRWGRVATEADIQAGPLADLEQRVLAAASTQSRPRPTPRQVRIR